MPHVLFAASGLFAFLHALHPIVDWDIWWHLAVGRELASQGLFPATDVFSHTAAAAPWDRHEWLFGLSLFTLWKIGGLDGLIVAKAVGIAAAVALVWRHAYEASNATLAAAPVPSPARDLRSAAAATVLAFLVAMAMRSFSLERPQIVSFVLFAAIHRFLDLSDAGALRRGTVLWTPLFALWANLHAGAALGVLLVALHALGEWWREGFALRLDRGSRLRALAALAGLALVAFSLNPLGPALWAFPFGAFTGQVNFHRIQEWQSPSLSDWPFYTLLLVASAAALLLGRRRLCFEHALLVVLLAALSLMHRRHGAFFVLAAAPIVARAFAGAAARLLSAFPRWTDRLPSGDVPAGSALASLSILAMAAVTLSSVIDREILRLGVSERRYPDRIVRFLESEAGARRIFNLYDWGGYLIWKLHPAVPVFVDGRLVLYGGLIRDYFRIQDADAAWEDLLAKHGVTLAATNHDYMLSLALATSPNWTPVHLDEQGVVYAKNAPGNAGLISRLGYRAIRPDSPSLCRPADAAAALAELDRALVGDPTSSRLRYYRGQVLMMLSRPQEAEDEFRLAVGHDPAIANPYAVLARFAESRGRPDEASRLWGKLAEITGDASARDASRSAARVRLPSVSDAPLGVRDPASFGGTNRPTAAPAVDAPAGFVQMPSPASVRHESIAASEEGLALARGGRNEDARTKWEEAVRLDPKNYMAWTNLGGATLTAGDLPGALECFRKALAANPAFAPAHYNRGWALEVSGRRQEASSSYEAALRLDPSFQAAQQGLSRTAPR